MKKTLYLMRHGQTIFNQLHKVQGWCDSPLTPLGIAQAKHAAHYFIDNQITFDHVYNSTSERACDTTELVTDMPYTRCKGLKEYNFGRMEGESELLDPPLPYGDFFKRYYGGESEMEVRQRMNTTLDEIMAKDDHQIVLAISHGGAIRQFMRFWEATQQIEVKTMINNCAIAKFEYEDHTFSLVNLYNEDLSSLPIE